MKIRVGYTVDVDDDLRRAINRYSGRSGLATRDEVRRWYERYGESMDLDLAAYYSDDETAEDRRRQEELREEWGLDS